MTIPFHTIFPTYDLGLRKPKNSKINIGSKRIYVDFPYWVYEDFYKLIEKYSMRPDSSKFIFEFKESSRKKIKELLYSKSFFSVRFGGGLAYDETATLNVNWSIFFSYLSEKAEYYSNLILSSRGDKAIHELYKSLKDNYNKISIFAVKESRWSNYKLKSYIKTLKLTGDYYRLQNLYLLIYEIFSRLISNNLNKFEEDPSLLLDRIFSDTSSSISSIQNMDTVTIFLFLRRLIEYTFIIISKSKNYLKLNDKSKKLLKKINTENIKDFCKENKLQNSRILANLYSCCNQVIHNESPTEFNSVLEFKVIINLVKSYIDGILELFVKFFDLNRSQLINQAEPFTTLANAGEPKLSKREKIAFKMLHIKYKDLVKTEIKNVLSRREEIKKKDIFFDPAMLGSIFYLFSPSYVKILNGIFNFQDVYNFIGSITQLSYKIALTQEFESTWSWFIKELNSPLDKINEYSKLNLNNDEKRTVIFCILADNLASLTESYS